MNVLPIAQILAANDGSSPAIAAFRFAVQLARDADARITALYVAVPVLRFSSFERDIRPAEQAEYAARAKGARVLEEARHIADGQILVHTELIFGDPAQIICQRARELPADLVVVGNRGFNSLQRLLLGSVSTAVVKHAPCSVLVVRAQQVAQQGRSGQALRSGRLTR
jgi:nucleotide-binding universal stress UspA family protein